jgi:excisionase family DNA binding protein
MTPVSERTPVFPSAGEERQMHRLSAILQQEARGARLVSSSGEELEIPDSVYEVLMQVVQEMDQGHGVTLMPEHAELSTQRAAEMLNVSRPHLVSLLEQGEIPFHKVGRHRRVRLADLLAYRDLRDSNRRRLLKKMTEDAQEAGLYDE